MRWIDGLSQEFKSAPRRVTGEDVGRHWGSPGFEPTRKESGSGETAVPAVWVKEFVGRTGRGDD
jgi:hypothetical protein